MYTRSASAMTGLPGPVGGLQDGVGRIPISEAVPRDLIGIDVFDAFAPLLGAEARGDSGLSSAVRTCDDQQDRLQRAPLRSGRFFRSHSIASRRAVAMSSRNWRSDASWASRTWAKA